MQILTPTGYKDIADCAVGDEVCAFDIATGAPIINHIEEITPVDEDVFESWQNPKFSINGKPTYLGLQSFRSLVPEPPYAEGRIKYVKEFQVGDQFISGDEFVEIEEITQLDENPEFIAYRINETWSLFAHQSIWIGPENVCHAQDLKVGDTIYDDADHPVTITSIEGLKNSIWHRLAISGDHSYIADGLTLHNASRFWVGGTGTWDSSTTTNWAATTGGAGGQSVPVAGDAVTLDGSSGGGTVTVNHATLNVASITGGAHTGTLDFATNNNNITITSFFSYTGAGARTLNMGGGIWTISIASGNTIWDCGTVTNFTLNANGSTILISSTAPSTRQTISGGTGKVYNILSVAGTTTGFPLAFANNATFTTFTMSGPRNLYLGSSTTTITNAFTFAGTPSNLISIFGGDQNGGGNIVATGGGTMDWAILFAMAFTVGTVVATNSYSLKSVSGVTVRNPSGRVRGLHGIEEGLAA